VFTTTINPFKRLAAAHKTSAAGQQHDRRQMTSVAAHKTSAAGQQHDRRQLTSRAAHQATAAIRITETTADVSSSTPGDGWHQQNTQTTADISKTQHTIRQLKSAAEHRSSVNISCKTPDIRWYKQQHTRHQPQHPVTRYQLISSSPKHIYWHGHPLTRPPLPTAAEQQNTRHQLTGELHPRHQLTRWEAHKTTADIGKTAHQATADISNSSPDINSYQQQQHTSVYNTSSKTEISWGQQQHNRHQLTTAWLTATTHKSQFTSKAGH
jgi:hypothetical protein